MGDESLESKTCWKWSKNEFWDHYKWDKEDHFWYHPLQSLKTHNIVNDAEKYIKYTAWGKARPGTHKKNLVKIFHEREEFEEDKQEWDQNQGDDQPKDFFFPSTRLICLTSVKNLWSMYFVVDV